MPKLDPKTIRIYLLCLWTFAKHHERIGNFKETCDLKHIYKNKSDKVYFSHDSIYSDRNYLAKSISKHNL